MKLKTQPTVSKVEPKKKMKKSKAAIVEVSLPDEPSEPRPNIGDYVLWFYGSPGIGKTTLASMFPGAMFLMFETGVKSLRVYERHVNKWPEFAAYISQLQKSDRFNTSVVDVVEKAYAMCFQYMCKKLVIEHPHDANDFGKSWGKINNEFFDRMGEISTIPHMGSILISHAANTPRKTRTGEEVEDIHPALTGKPLEALEGSVDLLGYMHIRKNKHVMQIRSTDDIMAKCRLEENFRYTDGSPIMYIPLGESKQSAYENFMAAFNNELSPPEKEAAPTRTPTKKLKKK